MAINKAKTSPLMKAFIIFLIVAFVVTIGAASIPEHRLAVHAADREHHDADADAAATLEQINANFQPGVDALVAATASEPTSYTAHVNLGNAYFDWAQTLSTPAEGASTVPTASLAAAGPLWVSAKDAYAKAIKIQPGDPAVETDYAIVTFYSMDTSGAITIGERVIKTNPDFAQAWLNLGVFYAQAGDTAKAIAAFEKYLKLDPNGDNAAFAKDQVASLKSASTTP